MPPWPSMARHAKACRDEDSWNHAVLEVPLCDTPMGTQLGLALICEWAALRKPLINATKIDAITSQVNRSERILDLRWMAGHMCKRNGSL